MRDKITRALVCVALGASLSGCSLWQNAEVVAESPANNTTAMNKNIPASQRQAASQRAGSLKDLFSAPDEKDAALERNPDLWAASLDVLSAFPLRSTDIKGGVIITDWITGEATQSQVTVRVEGNRIVPRFLVVNVLKRNASGMIMGTDATAAQALQTRILDRAKALRNKREGNAQ